MYKTKREGKPKIRSPVILFLPESRRKSGCSGCVVHWCSSSDLFILSTNYVVQKLWRYGHKINSLEKKQYHLITTQISKYNSQFITMLRNYMHNYAKRAATRSLQTRASRSKVPVPYRYGYSTVANYPPPPPIDHHFSSNTVSSDTFITPIHTHFFSTRANIIAPGPEVMKKSTELVSNGAGNKRTFAALTPDVADLIRAEFEVS